MQFNNIMSMIIKLHVGTWFCRSYEVLLLFESNQRKSEISYQTKSCCQVIAKQDDDSKYNDFSSGFISRLSISKIVVVCRYMIMIWTWKCCKSTKTKSYIRIAISYQPNTITSVIARFDGFLNAVDYFTIPIILNSLS